MRLFSPGFVMAVDPSSRIGMDDVIYEATTPA
jgi:hypothetical protein